MKLFELALQRGGYDTGSTEHEMYGHVFAVLVTMTVTMNVLTHAGTPLFCSLSCKHQTNVNYCNYSTTNSSFFMIHLNSNAEAAPVPVLEGYAKVPVSGDYIEAPMFQDYYANGPYSEDYANVPYSVDYADAPYGDDYTAADAPQSIDYDDYSGFPSSVLLEDVAEAPMDPLDYGPYDYVQPEFVSGKDVPGFVVPVVQDENGNPLVMSQDAVPIVSVILEDGQEVPVLVADESKVSVPSSDLEGNASATAPLLELEQQGRVPVLEAQYGDLPVDSVVLENGQVEPVFSGDDIGPLLESAAPVGVEDGLELEGHVEEDVPVLTDGREMREADSTFTLIGRRSNPGDRPRVLRRA